MSNLENFEVFSGENRTLTLHARDANNAVQNLTGLTIAWNVGWPPQDVSMTNAVFSKIGTIASASAGTFTVAILPGDTTDIFGDYEHQAVTTDSSGNLAVVSRGRLAIKRLIDT